MEEFKRQVESKTMVLEDIAPDISQQEKHLEAEKKLFPARFVEVEAKKQNSPLPSQKISLNAESKIVKEEQVQSEKTIKDLIEVGQEVEVVETPKVQEAQVKFEEKKEENLEDKKLKRADSKKLKTRLKIGFAVMIFVLTCLGGLGIYNAIRVKTLTAETAAANEKYNISVVKVISNISKLDDLTNPNSITNLDELSSAKIIEVAPKTETFPKTLEKQSNWFDRVCNWLSNLFK